LPFCLVVPFSQSHNEDVTRKEAIIKSIEKLNYTNYKAVEVNEDISINSMSENNYFGFRQTIVMKCAKNTLILFLNSLVKPNSLKFLNDLHQKFNIWATYTLSEEVLEVHSFYWRVYELLEKNDFSMKNQHFLKSNDRVHQALGLLELSSVYSKKVYRDLIF
jgi:hypothetical protein